MKSHVPVLPPQKYAGVLAFGGILDYDVNNITGGAGAAYLGTRIN